MRCRPRPGKVKIPFADAGYIKSGCITHGRINRADCPFDLHLFISGQDYGRNSARKAKRTGLSNV
ncbi:MAG: hypothetical protein EBZ18_04075 [Alphaproteobacteria bacterium]|nr:hypothetical protein [Alphaproteobacteria bacterium]